MAVTIDDVRAALSPDEPDYDAAARLGPEAVPHLEALILGDDMSLATKATSLLGFIPDPRAASILRLAAGHHWATVRAAAGAVARRLDPEIAAQVLVSLLADSDPGIRKVALLSAPPGSGDQIDVAIARVAETDALPELRQLATEVRSRRR
jgi:HEAT repeat protein